VSRTFTSSSNQSPMTPSSSLLLSLLDSENKMKINDDDDDDEKIKELNILSAQKMLGLWSAAIGAKRIDERRALLDCIAILSPSCT